MAWFIPNTLQPLMDTPGTKLFESLTESPMVSIEHPDYFMRKQELIEAGLKDAEKVILKERQMAAQNEAALSSQLKERQNTMLQMKERLEQEQDQLKRVKQDLSEEQKSTKRMRGEVEELSQSKNYLEGERKRLVAKTNRVIDERDAATSSAQRFQQELQDTRQRLEEAMRKPPSQRDILRQRLQAGRNATVEQILRPKDIAEAMKMRFSAQDRDSTYLNLLHAEASSINPGLMNELLMPSGEARAGEAARDVLLDPAIRWVVDHRRQI